jgi:hypothetical protein
MVLRRSCCPVVNGVFGAAFALINQPQRDRMRGLFRVVDECNSVSTNSLALCRSFCDTRDRLGVPKDTAAGGAMAGSFASDHSFNDPSCEAGKEGESLMLS